MNLQFLLECPYFVFELLQLELEVDKSLLLDNLDSLWLTAGLSISTTILRFMASVVLLCTQCPRHVPISMVAAAPLIISSCGRLRRLRPRRRPGGG
jgi:hypothetical protein